MHEHMFDEASMKTLTVGSFAVMPKEMRHYVQAKEATIIQVHGIGPFALTYVNPADDPRKRCPDITKARRLLGFEPEVALEEGIRLTAADFRARLVSG